MNIIIKRHVAQRIGYKFFAPFGISVESWKSGWRDDHEIDLGELSRNELDDLEELFLTHKKVRGVNVLLTDIKLWRSALEGGVDTKRARTVRQFETLLKQYLLDVPGHRIYKRHTDGAMLCYYVNDIEYVPPVTDRNGSSPAYVTMELVYEKIGGQTKMGVNFNDRECRGVPVAQALAEKGYTPETNSLREAYLKTKALYVKIAPQVGRQYWGRGRSFVEGDRYDWDRSVVSLDRDGERSRVVVDVFNEKDEDHRRDRSVYVSSYFWANVKHRNTYDPKTDEDRGDIDEDDSLEGEDPEVPIHPWLIVFHLARHLRLRCHVDQLQEYVYDKELADKLVLPGDTKKLVSLLIDTRGGMFEDLVAGKGGGAVVLLTGPPGTGKTLTAEVYAEAEERALYSVQCSQLGTNPEELEGELMKVFERAKRWNAVMLLDEADVYVRERGGDLQQNAIVGVFLRVLEYQATILFLTTNRPKDVDDAIASRCIARLPYTIPVAEDAKQIWRVLADNAGVKVDEDVIDEVVEKNLTMTGRDIKNILKLASLMTDPEVGITVETVDYVQQFKPTGEQENG